VNDFLLPPTVIGKWATKLKGYERCLFAKAMLSFSSAEKRKDIAEGRFE
jgi:hypothetical protein